MSASENRWSFGWSAGIAAAFGTALVVLAACGAADDVEAAGGSAGQGGTSSSVGGFGGEGPDAGPADTGPSGGSGGSGGSPIDGSVDGDAGSLLRPFQASPITYITHASHDLFAFRLCVEGDTGFATTYPFPSDVENHLPETNFPGIPVGGAVPIDEILDLIPPGSDLRARLVRADHPSVARAQPTAATPVTCADLFDPGSIDELPASEFVDLGPLPLSQIQANSVRAIIVEGCRADAGLTDATCGEGYNPAQGNLAWSVVGFSPALFSEPSTGHAFALHRSPSLAALRDAGATLEVWFENTDGESIVTADLDDNAVSPEGAQLTSPEDVTALGTTVFSLRVKENDAEDTLLRASLAQVQRVTSPYEDPSAFFTEWNGFVLLLLGNTDSDPWMIEGAWNPAYDGRGLHILALRFRFTATQ